MLYAGLFSHFISLESLLGTCLLKSLLHFCNLLGLSEWDLLQTASIEISTAVFPPPSSALKLIKSHEELRELANPGKKPQNNKKTKKLTLLASWPPVRLQSCTGSPQGQVPDWLCCFEVGRGRACVYQGGGQKCSTSPSLTLA